MVEKWSDTKSFQYRPSLGQSTSVYSFHWIISKIATCRLNIKQMERRTNGQTIWYWFRKWFQIDRYKRTERSILILLNVTYVRPNKFMSSAHCGSDVGYKKYSEYFTQFFRHTCIYMFKQPYTHTYVHNLWQFGLYKLSKDKQRTKTRKQTTRINVIKLDFHLRFMLKLLFLLSVAYYEPI